MKIINLIKYESNNGNQFDTEEEAVIEDLSDEFEEALTIDQSFYVSDFNASAILTLADLIKFIKDNPELFQKIMATIVR